MSPIFSEALSEAFYRWELRGRGWHGTDDFVMLEPAFEPFTVPYSIFERPPVRDDGLRPTLLGSLAKLITGETHANEMLVSHDTDEIGTMPVILAPDSEATKAIDIRVPASFVSRADTAITFLRALSAAQAPVAFEIVGVSGEVHVQLNVRESDFPHIRASLEGYFPDVAVIEDAPDRLLRAWEDEAPSLIVDFGLSNEFFLPLSVVANYTIDPFIPLVGALANTSAGETLCYQILFERVRNPWREAIRDAVAGPDGSGIFADAPDFMRLAHEKTDTPLFAAVLRIAGQAESVERAKRLVQSTLGFVGQYERLPGNHFIPLTNEGYDDRRHMYALLLRESHRAGMILNTSELAALVHMPDTSVRQSALSRIAIRSKAAPPSLSAEALQLGINTHHGKSAPVGVSTIDRLAHMHIVGASGTGKSTFLLGAALADIEANHGVVVLDPHGDLIDDLLLRIPESRLPDVVLFDPSDPNCPVTLNPLTALDEIEKDHLASDIVSLFQKQATSWGDSMGAVLSNAVLALVESKRGGTLLDLRRFLLDAGTRAEYLAEIDDEEIRFFWEQSFKHIGTRSIGPILTRLDSFLRSKTMRRIVSAPQSSVDWEQVLSGKRIFLAKLSLGLVGEENGSLLGSLLVSILHQAALRRQRQRKDERTPAFIYLDEFQHFVTPSMAALLSEGRKFATGLVLAHQTLAQIGGSSVESAVMGNAHARMVFRVGEQDATKLASGFLFFEARDIIALQRGQAIVRLGTADCDFNVETTLPCEPVRQGLPAMLRAPDSGLPSVEDSRTASPSILPSKSEIEPSSEATTEPVTEVQASAFLPTVFPKGRHRSQEHQYLANVIARLGQERGFKAILEEPVAGGRVDIALRRADVSVACEVSVSTEVAHELGNAKKCVAVGFDHVILIATDDRKRARIQKALAKDALLLQVQVMSPEALAAFLDTLALSNEPSEQIVRGYKVKVKRQPQSPSDTAARRETIGKIITRSITKEV